MASIASDKFITTIVKKKTQNVRFLSLKTNILGGFSENWVYKLRHWKRGGGAVR
jgi:hypothetical protein